jgi:hypothetical protein
MFHFLPFGSIKAVKQAFYSFCVLAIFSACQSDKKNDSKIDTPVAGKPLAIIKDDSAKDTGVRYAHDTARNTSKDTIPTAKLDSNQKMPIYRIDSLKKYH